MAEGCEALAEKERQTLRLLLVGHDAKSMARELGLSVHTINERLRASRRKLAVSSSKEAARLLRESEALAPEKLGDKPLGDDPPARPADAADPPLPRPTSRRAGWAIGAVAMISILAAALAMLAPAATPAPTPDTAAVQPSDAARAARAWLELVDAGRWEASWAGTAASFQAVNSVAAWRAASEQARVPLGRVEARTLLDEQDTPAPPHGYRTIRFRTDFANKAGAIETVSLDRDGGSWKVAGVYIE